jgi:hypothetical protein
MARSVFSVRGGSTVVVFAGIALLACAQQLQAAQPEPPGRASVVQSVHTQGYRGLPTGTVEVISFLSLVFSAVALWQTRRSVRASTLIGHLSEIVQVESRLGELPSALRFHGLTKENLNKAGIDGPEFAYLLNSFTLASVRQDILRPKIRSVFPRESYRYQMCLSKDTRKAWPLIKKLMNPSPFVDRIDRTIKSIEKEEHSSESAAEVLK